MIKTKHSIQALIFTILLTACGGGGSSDSENKSENLTSSTISSMTLSSEVENNSNSNNQTEEEKIPELPTTGNSSPQREIESIEEEINIETNQPTANAGADTSTIVNETITLVGTAINVGTQEIFYEWKKGISILSKTAWVDYTPKEDDSLPTAGERVDILTFTISNKDGFLDSDQINIIVYP